VKIHFLNWLFPTTTNWIEGHCAQSFVKQTSVSKGSQSLLNNRRMWIEATAEKDDTDSDSDPDADENTSWRIAAHPPLSLSFLIPRKKGLTIANLRGAMRG
jgi:hypothetical protein